MKKPLALIASAVVAVAVLAGCTAGGPQAPLCSKAVQKGLLSSVGSYTESKAFPVPELVTTGGLSLYCYLGVNRAGQKGGLALYDGGTTTEKKIESLLKGMGYKQDKTTKAFAKGRTIVAAGVNGDTKLAAGDGVPKELVGKKLVVLSVGTEETK